MASFGSVKIFEIQNAPNAQLQGQGIFVRQWDDHFANATKALGSQGELVATKILIAHPNKADENGEEVGHGEF